LPGKKIPGIKLGKGITNLRCENASVAVTKLMDAEGDGRVEVTRVAGVRGKERRSLENYKYLTARTASRAEQCKA
jgi:hypothetical protein